METRIFQKVLVDFMRENNLTQMQVSEKIGMRQSQVSNWINGKSEPTWRSILTLSIAFNVCPSFWFGGDA